MATNVAYFEDDPETILPERANRLRNKIIADAKNHVHDGEGQKFKEYARFTSHLPPLRKYPSQYKELFLAALQDDDLRDDLQTHNIINWCKITKTLYPIKTKADGNCLLHAVSKYVWGVDDRFLFLRRILYVNLATDTKGRYKQRWRFNQQTLPDLQQANARLDTSDYENEWDTVIKETEDISQTGNHGLPYCTLQAVHLYVLANTFRRPIIVLADHVARNVFGQSLQESHIGGIYLPLEWNPGLCHKHPIVIGYNMNHFVPLLMEVGIQSGIEQSVPIVSHELLSLGLQFLLPGEEQECTKMLQDYLEISEVVHKGTNGNVNIPIAKVLHKELPEKYDMMEIYRKDSEAKFRQLMDQEAGIIPKHPEQPQNQPFRFEVSKRSGKQENGYIRNESNPSAHNAVNLVINTVPLSGQKEIQKGEPFKCRTMGCDMYGNPEMRNLCSKCFGEFTVVYSKQEEAERHLHNQQKPQNGLPPPTAGGEYHDLSMMGEDCKCGFKCSTETYPYCHECFPGQGQPQPPVLHQPPAGPDLSIMPDKCIGEGCTFQCSKATHPYCHECYSKYTSPQLQEPTAPPLVEPVETRNTSQHGDQHLQLRMETQAKETQQTLRIGEDKTPEHLSSQTTVSQPEVLTQSRPSGELLKKCKTENCNNRAVKGNDGTCDTCYSQAFFGSGQTSSSPPDEALLNEIRNLSNERCCVNPSCNEEVTLPSTTQCLQCFLRGDIEEPTKTNKTSTNNEKPFTLNISSPETAEETKILNSGTEQQGLNLSIPLAQATGLNLSGSLGAPGVQYTATEPALPEMPVLSPISPMEQAQVFPQDTTPHRKYLCSTAGCEGIRNENGYCYSCSKNNVYRRPPLEHMNVSMSGAVVTSPSGEAEQSNPLEVSCTPHSLTEEQKKELNPLITSSRQKVKCASSSCSNFIYPPMKLCAQCDGFLKRKQAQKSLEENKKSVQGMGVPCKTPGCQFFGTPEMGNYCSSCYKSGAGRHTAPISSQKHPATTKKHDTAPLQLLPKPVGKPCIVPGCSRFGDPKQADRCYQHYTEAMAKLPPAMSDQSIARYENGPIKEQKRPPKPANQNVAFHRHTIGSSPIVPVSTKADPYVVAMGKVESSRKSNLLCKNNTTRGCQNYGNSKNKGYCNTCFPEVQQLETLRRTTGVIGQNQFG